MDSLEVDLPISGSGWTMSTALGMNDTFATVRVTGGEFTTVPTWRMQG